MDRHLSCHRCPLCISSPASQMHAPVTIHLVDPMYFRYVMPAHAFLRNSVAPSYQTYCSLVTPNFRNVGHFSSTIAMTLERNCLSCSVPPKFARSVSSPRFKQLGTYRDGHFLWLNCALQRHNASDGFLFKNTFTEKSSS